MYDLVLKGGTVVDPSMGLRGVYDIAVQDGRIASIASTIAREEATRVLEVAGTGDRPAPVTIVIPAFNEEAGIGRLLGQLTESPDFGPAMEIIVAASKLSSSNGSSCASPSTVSSPFAAARSSFSTERSTTTGVHPSRLRASA